MVRGPKVARPAAVAKGLAWPERLPEGVVAPRGQQNDVMGPKVARSMADAKAPPWRKRPPEGVIGPWRPNAPYRSELGSFGLLTW